MRWNAGNARVALSLVGYEEIEPIPGIHCRSRAMGSCLSVRVEVPVDGGVAVMISLRA